jgi:hypothetical protein
MSSNQHGYGTTRRVEIHSTPVKMALQRTLRHPEVRANRFYGRSG